MASGGSSPGDLGMHRPASRREEAMAFIVLAVLIWPVAAVAVVGGYGFLIWMWQLVFGPPGPPS